MDTCPSCGSALDEHDRHVRFTLPDPVFESARRDAAEGTWMSHGTARESELLQVPNIGAFVRALLPIRLTGGHTVTYGVWVAVGPDDLPRIFAAWYSPEYPDLTITGWLANAIEPWGMLAAPVRAVVREPGEIPYCDRSEDPQLDRVLREEWPHELILG